MQRNLVGGSQREKNKLPMLWSGEIREYSEYKEAASTKIQSGEHMY